VLCLELVRVVDQFRKVAVDAAPGHVNGRALAGKDQVRPADRAIPIARGTFHQAGIHGNFRGERTIACSGVGTVRWQIDPEVAPWLGYGVVAATG